MEQKKNRIEMRNISKSFGGERALNNVHFEVRPGEIHALIGENGAGKSTLMKILAGAISRDEGTIIIDGKERHISRPMDAIKLGISVIYQEFMLAPHLSVAENIFIDTISGKKAVINWKELRKKAYRELSRLGFTGIDPAAKVSSLSVAYQQVTEICKCLARSTKVLVLDEPTAVLTFTEIEKLFGILLRLKSEGVSIVYISHRLEEVLRITDRITIMKDGTKVDTVNTGETTKDHLVTMMVGRDLSQLFAGRNAKIGEIVLEVKNLNAGKLVKDVSFHVRSGELVGFSGLVGSGRTETMRAVFGAMPIDSGEIIYQGKQLRFTCPHAAIVHGLGLLSEDRKKEGVMLFQSIRINATMTRLNKVSKAGILDRKKESQAVGKLLASLSTKYGSIDSDVCSLSGGNQQKVAIAKWVFADCKCLIFDEPTRGVDVGAKLEIYKIISRLAERGIAVIVISSEMLEIIGLCDRAYVMRQGMVAGELSKQDLNEESLIRLAMGA
ncbi:MAG: sugar ABC transporter ATP-binding protein [Spirochaetaceae bacterium]|jgi:ribose transport system ATP-binding protein|nr:sugar ABC transporter ATP-binding protein [Spirochaetaceae bacterium]